MMSYDIQERSLSKLSVGDVFAFLGEQKVICLNSSRDHKSYELQTQAHLKYEVLVVNSLSVGCRSYTGSVEYIFRTSPGKNRDFAGTVDPKVIVYERWML
jgi:hypothetical protein